MAKLDLKFTCVNIPEQLRKSYRGTTVRKGLLTAYLNRAIKQCRTDEISGRDGKFRKHSSRFENLKLNPQLNQLQFNGKRIDHLANDVGTTGSLYETK